MLVTPDGEWVLADSPGFLVALGDPDPDYDGAMYAVKNLGFVKFEIVDQSLVEIELHPRNVELPALLAVQQKLLTAPQRLFRLKYFETAWQSEISASAEHTVARLSELCAPAAAPPPTQRFVVEPKDISALYSDERNELRPLAQKWRVAFGHFDSSITALALRHDLLSRMVIVGIRPRDREPRFRFIGEGHRWMGSEYLLKGLGEKVENLPDKEYGAWAGEFYKAVAASGQPRYDVVSAALQYQNEERRPRRMIRYERLLLPWKTPSEEVFVTLCSKLVGSAASAEASYSPPDSATSRKSANSA